MPAVSQLGMLPGGGASGNTQRGTRFAGQDRHRLAGGANRAAVNPGYVEFYRGFVEQVSRFEIVGPVKDEINVGTDRAAWRRSMSATIGSMSISELIRRSFAAAAIALGKPAATSDSSYKTCR